VTRDDIIRLAREAGGGLESDYTNISALQRFAALVAAAERTDKDSSTVDAERYRWLRAETDGVVAPLARVVWKRNNIRDSGDWANLSDGQTLDEHIDAAIRARGESK